MCVRAREILGPAPFAMRRLLICARIGRPLFALSRSKKGTLLVRGSNVNNIIGRFSTVTVAALQISCGDVRAIPPAYLESQASLANMFLVATTRAPSARVCSAYDLDSILFVNKWQQ
ncbi:unnamed protein product [Phaeothamnion confervicola]